LRQGVPAKIAARKNKNASTFAFAPFPPRPSAVMFLDYLSIMATSE
jgi:hypothetical protein